MPKRFVTPPIDPVSGRVERLFQRFSTKLPSPPIENWPPPQSAAAVRWAVSLQHRDRVPYLFRGVRPGTTQSGTSGSARPPPLLNLSAPRLTCEKKTHSDPPPLRNGFPERIIQNFVFASGCKSHALFPLGSTSSRRLAHHSAAIGPLCWNPAANPPGGR